METLKGITVNIYRDSNQNQPINILNGKNRAVLIGDNIAQIFEATNEYPALKIVTRHLFGRDYIHAEPISKEPFDCLFFAFGGSFIYSCDSRFRELFDYPIPLHDRNMNLETKQLLKK